MITEVKVLQKRYAFAMSSIVTVRTVKQKDDTEVLLLVDRIFFFEFLQHPDLDCACLSVLWHCSDDFDCYFRERFGRLCLHDLTECSLTEQPYYLVYRLEG
jgi:hypothetical protein